MAAALPLAHLRVAPARARTPGQDDLVAKGEGPMEKPGDLAGGPTQGLAHQLAEVAHRYAGLLGALPYVDGRFPGGQYLGGKGSEGLKDAAALAGEDGFQSGPLLC